MTTESSPRRRSSPRETLREILAPRITDPMELHQTLDEAVEALKLPATWTSPGVRLTAGNPY